MMKKIMMKIIKFDTKMRVPTDYKERLNQRLKEHRELSLEYKLGYLLGDLLWITMPTLSVNSVTSYNVISVLEEEQKEAEKLSANWFELEQLYPKKNRTGKELNKIEEAWFAFRKYHHSLDEKYLPKTYTKYFDIYIPEHSDTIKGIISSLWNCDGCTYSLNEEDIKIENPLSGIRFNGVTLIYKPNEIKYS